MTKILRVGMGVYAVVLAVGGTLFFIRSSGSWRWVVAGYILVNVVVILGGVLFERGRYYRRDLPIEGWQPTGERFVEESSGKVIEVEYHAATGQRRYREVGLAK